MFLLTEWFGSFLLEDGGRVRDKVLFPREPADLAATLRRIERGEVLLPERELAAQAKDGPLGVVEDRLLGLPGARMARDGAPSLASRAAEFGFDERLLHDAALLLGRSKVRDASGSRDQQVVQAVDAIDELSAQANVLIERLREWYGLHYPELTERIERGEEIAGLVSQHGTRERLLAVRPDLPESDMGADVTPEDAEAVRGLARSASTLYATRAQLEKYLDETMPSVAPNVTALTGAVLAARLLRHAGGLRRLAMLPAGTIQTLGAEKALFRHIKEGKRPPKHGILFQHPALHRAPRWQRGNLARALAGKIALAARGDALTKDSSIGPRLAQEFEARAQVIGRERAKAPPRKFGPPGGARGGHPREGGFRRGPPRGPPGPPQGGFRKGGFQKGGAPRDFRKGGFQKGGPPPEFRKGSFQKGGPPPEFRKGSFQKGGKRFHKGGDR